MTNIRLTALFLCCCVTQTHAQTAGKIDPAVQKIVGEISAERIGETLQKLGSFGTRGDYTDPTQESRGIGAARKWIYEQFRSYSPKLEVAFDPYKVKKQGRIFRDVELVNVVAVLPGTTMPEKRIIISGHYDSISLLRRAATPQGTNPDTPGSSADAEKMADAPSPGVSDDASGTAAVMELARVMSQYKFEKTLVFVTFAGEEIGLVGASLMAEKAKNEKQQIEAVLNNDIIGNDVGGDGQTANRLVNVYSEDPIDSPSRTLARYVKETAERYVPGMKANPVFRADRFGRGGDHTPFAANGFAAVRFTTPVENLQAQHSANDTFDKASPAYTAMVAKVNAAAAASLALAPATPQVGTIAGPRSAQSTAAPTAPGATPAPPRTGPNLGRGKTMYDAVLRWNDPKPATDLAGYSVVMRQTTSPFWESEVFVGKVNEFTLPGVNIDMVVLGVKAIDNDGNQSLVAPYVSAPTAIRKFELVDDKK